MAAIRGAPFPPMFSSKTLLNQQFRWHRSFFIFSTIVSFLNGQLMTLFRSSIKLLYTGHTVDHLAVVLAAQRPVSRGRYRIDLMLDVTSYGTVVDVAFPYVTVTQPGKVIAVSRSRIVDHFRPRPMSRRRLGVLCRRIPSRPTLRWWASKAA